MRMTKMIDHDYDYDYDHDNENEEEDGSQHVEALEQPRDGLPDLNGNAQPEHSSDGKGAAADPGVRQER